MNTELTRLVAQERLRDMRSSADEARLARGERHGRGAVARARSRIVGLFAAGDTRRAAQPTADPCAERAGS
jgi:hypothetical protein